MKSFYYFLCVSAILVYTHTTNAINLKALLIGAFATQQTQGRCGIYNPTPHDIIIKNSERFFFRTFQVSTTTIPAGKRKPVHHCDMLEIVCDEPCEHKIIPLEEEDQPHGTTQAFTVTEEPCYDDCAGIITQLRLVPGLPESYTSQLSKFSKEDLEYLSHQIRHDVASIKPKTCTSDDIV